MKAYERWEIQLSASKDEHKHSVSHGSHLSMGMETRYPMNRSPGDDVVAVAKQIIRSLPEMNSGSPNRSLVTILTELSRSL
jgi:hypothetical protein